MSSGLAQDVGHVICNKIFQITVPVLKLTYFCDGELSSAFIPLDEIPLEIIKAMDAWWTYYKNNPEEYLRSGVLSGSMIRNEESAMAELTNGVPQYYLSCFNVSFRKREIKKFFSKCSEEVQLTNKAADRLLVHMCRLCDKHEPQMRNDGRVQLSKIVYDLKISLAC